MAQSIQIAGASFPDVPSILVPKVGSGTAIFADPSITTAIASDVASGKKFLLADGSISTGTASGGSSWTKITSSENTVSTTSSTAASAFTLSIGSQYYTQNKILWVHIRDKAGKRAGYFYGSDAFLLNHYAAEGKTTTVTNPAVVVYRYTSSSEYGAYTGQYGVWGYSLNSSGTLTVRRRYSSNYSLTINGTYVTTVYALDLPSGVTLFD